MDLELINKQVVALAKEVGAFIREQNKKSKEIEIKGKNNFVTYTDKTSEELIVEGLQKILPEAGFIAEEGSNTTKGERYNWIIDPLDGTTNFIHGLPPFAISIALSDNNNKMILGVVYEIVLDECFYAWQGSNAYLNGHEISVSQIDKVENSLIATGFPYTYFSRIEKFMQTLDYFMKNSHGVRRLGSAATDLVYVACGRFEAFYEYNLSPWDVAAGAFIVQQAGGKVCDFKGGDDYIFGKEIIATNAATNQEFKKIIADIMN